MAALAYDPLGRLWQVSAPSGTTRFVYDGDHIAIEYDTAGTLLRAYVHGAGADEPVIWYEVATGGALRRYFHADHQGSIVAGADTGANALFVNGYDSWGIPNSANQGRFGYTGQTWIPELGMWHYKARIYSPTLGRFLQTDPVGYDDQVNLYAYVGNDPVNGADPTGECSEITNEDGSMARSGICGNTAEERGLVNQMLTDEDSRFSAVESAAVESGQLVNLRFGSTVTDADGNVQPVTGGVTQVTDYSDGSRDITVTIDPNDAVTLRGENALRRSEDREVTTQEVAEHEVVGHAGPAVERQENSNQRSIAADNDFRRRSGIAFRRTSHNDRVRVRSRH